MRRIIASVPATSANLGPGFDCFGLALDLRSDVEMRLDEPFSISVEGDGAARLPRDRRNLVSRTINDFYERVGRPPPSFALTLRNRIPLTGGLGSSSAALVGALMVANVSAGRPMTDANLLDLAVEIEGHPDNVAPAVAGGLVVAVSDGSGLVTLSVPVPTELSAVLFVPPFTMPTRRSRQILPQVVPRHDAIFNVGRVALWLAALQTGRLDLLTVATQDRLHQPYRARIFPALPAIIEAALAAGACGACLSGSGSAILALVRGDTDSVGPAMQIAARAHGIHGRCLKVGIDRVGATVRETA